MIRNIVTAVTAAVLLTAGGVRAEHDVDAAPTAADVEAQYAAVLSAMKKPVATGVLVTEVGPGSPAGGAGLKAGDVIVQLGGRDVRNLQALRERVAELIATNEVQRREDNVLLVVRRAVTTAGAAVESETKIFQVPREPLGIRALEVTAGVSAALNPPASARGTVAMAWGELRQLQNAGGDLGQKAYLRMMDAEGEWLGWQVRGTEAVADDVLLGQAEVNHIDVVGSAAKVVNTETVTFRLRTGDYTTAPAFLLDWAEVVMGGTAAATVKTIGRRAGTVMKTETETTWHDRIEGPVKRERAAPVTALLSVAMPVVAAAMPQQKDAVLGVNLVSVRDFVARPGYVLATRGKQALGGEGAGAEKDVQAWRVDLMHCGVILESYYFNDQRRLLRQDSFSGSTVVLRRVGTEREARSSAEEKGKVNVPAATNPSF